MRKRDCSTGSNGAKSSQRTRVKKPLLCKEWLFWIVVVCVRGNVRTALQNHNGKSCPAFLEKGGILLKSFTSVSVFTEETPQSAYGCQLPFQGSLLHKLLVCVLVQSCQNRPAEFARCTRCPPGACQRRLLPLPVLVMLLFKRFLVQAGNFISYGVCKLVNRLPFRGAGKPQA